MVVARAALLLMMLSVGFTGQPVGAQGAPQSDTRTFGVVTHTTTPPTASVLLELADNLVGPADRSTKVAAYRLTDALYLRVIPESHRDVERGAFAYAFLLTRDAAGEKALPAINQPGHGPTANLLRAMDFRNSDNTGPNAVGPKNVNAAGAFREILFAEHVMEIRVLSFQIVGLGPSRIPAFARVSCLVTVRKRGT